MKHRTRTRLRLLVQFGVGSLVPVALLGATLAIHERDNVQAQAESSTAAFGQTAARGLVSYIITPSRLTGPMSPAQLDVIDRVLRGLRVGGNPPHVRIRSADGYVRYSDTRSELSRYLPVDRDFARALGGTPVTVHTTERFGSQAPPSDVLAVDLPTSLVSPTAPDGVVQLYFSYRPIAATVSRDFRQSAVLISLGLAALWLVLLPLVLSVARRLEEQVEHNEHLALHDALTGLANRTLLADRVDQALAQAARHDATGAFLLLDVDRFKEVNDTLGHHQGDTLLRLVADRLAGGMRVSDTVARLGGDEFVILLSEVDSPAGALSAAERIEGLLADPFILGDFRLEAEVSIGLALFPDDGQTFEDLLQRADIAMYASKAAQAGPVMYSGSLNVASPSRLSRIDEPSGPTDTDRQDRGLVRVPSA